MSGSRPVKEVLAEYRCALRANAHTSDRLMARILVFGGLLLSIASIMVFRENGHLFSTVWNACAALVVLSLWLLAALERLLTLRTLRRIWLVLPLCYIFLLLCSFAGFAEPQVPPPAPWIWLMEAAVTGLLTLVLRPALAVLGALVSAVAPAISACLFLGPVPGTVYADSLLHIGNAAFIVMLIGMRAKLISIHRAHRAIRMREREEVRAKTHAEQLRAFALEVHDEVLATLAAALRFEGTPPEELRRDARRALDRIAALPARSGVRQSADAGLDELPSGVAAVAIARMVAASVPETRVTMQTHSGSVPRRAAEALGLACAEAARNSVRHSGSERGPEVRIEGRPDGMTVHITDDGAGFDPDGVSAERLGVRRGILERMRSVPGGEARISSGSQGTVVELTWHR